MSKSKRLRKGYNSGPLTVKQSLRLKKVAKCENKGPTMLSAVVNSKGKLIRGCYAVSADRIAEGRYEVIFSRDVRKGTYVATIGSPKHSGVSAPGEVTVVGRVSSNNGVFITTSRSDGSYKDLGFHLIVHCPEGFAY